MSSDVRVTADAAQQTAPGMRRVRRHARARVMLIIWLAALTASTTELAGVTISRAASTPPADLFMQSLVKDDGALGWHQLCPSIQAQLPESTLIKQADTERGTRAQQGITLTADFIGARPRPSGGQLRVYIVTAHWHNGTTNLRTFSVLTQPSGCVEDVASQ